MRHRPLRRAARALPLLLCLCAALGAHAQPSPSLERSTSAARIGFGLAALQHAAGLDAAQPTTPLAQALAHLSAHEPQLALDLLDDGAPPSERLHPAPPQSALTLARAWIRLQALLDLPPLIELTAAQSQALLDSPLCPPDLKDQLRLWQIQSAPPQPGPTAARALLWQWAEDTRDLKRQRQALQWLAAESAFASRQLALRFPTALTPHALPVDPPLDLDERHQRAEALHRDRAYSAQLALDQEIIEHPEASAAQRQAAHLRSATALLRLFERYPEALRHAEAASEGPNLAQRRLGHYRRSLIYGRLGQYDAAREATQATLDAQATGTLAREARYQLARLVHQAGQYEAARPQLAAFAQSQPPKDRATWRWFVGWSDYRAGDCPRARRVFAELVNDPNLLVGPKALYWTARCHLREGDPQRALQSLDRLSEEAPWSYYGALGQHLAHRIDPSRPAIAPRPAGAPFPSEGPDLSLWRDTLPAPLRTAADALLTLRALGLPQLSAHWSAQLDAAPLNAKQKQILDQLLERYGQRWARLPLKQRLLPWQRVALGADPAPLLEALPPAWAALGAQAEAQYGVSRWWLMAHLLQESRYRPWVKSHAGALGPMQILSRTARRIVGELGWPESPGLDDRLYEPGLALGLGAWYLHALREAYGGQVLWAMAAYNGGPRRMADHFAQQPTLEGDELVEELGAHESRNYMRKVADHSLRYAALYGSDAEYEALTRALVDWPQAPKAQQGSIDF